MHRVSYNYGRTERREACNHFLIGGSGYVGDGEAGWKTIARLVAALERNEIKSLERPICWRGSRKKKGEDPSTIFKKRTAWSFVGTLLGW